MNKLFSIITAYKPIQMAMTYFLLETHKQYCLTFFLLQEYYFCPQNSDLFVHHDIL